HAPSKTHPETLYKLQSCVSQATNSRQPADYQTAFALPNTTGKNLVCGKFYFCSGVLADGHRGAYARVLADCHLNIMRRAKFNHRPRVRSKDHQELIENALQGLGLERPVWSWCGVTIWAGAWRQHATSRNNPQRPGVILFFCVCTRPSQGHGRGEFNHTDRREKRMKTWTLKFYRRGTPGPCGLPPCSRPTVEVLADGHQGLGRGQASTNRKTLAPHWVENRDNISNQFAPGKPQPSIHSRTPVPMSPSRGPHSVWRTCP
ncbi:MAG: hypothetical protein JWR26_508, partial [Pedosphaera sp.]|nr:hypothetical protein [Pedosphaera sp.]